MSVDECTRTRDGHGRKSVSAIFQNNRLFMPAWIATLIFSTGMALKCYDCETTNNLDCSPLFKPSNIKQTVCSNTSLMCAMQRQPAIRRVKQVAAIGRGCYREGSLPGLDSTPGCRNWTNSINFTALYCFCDTDLCNSAEPVIRFRAPTELSTVLYYTIYSVQIAAIIPSVNCV